MNFWKPLALVLILNFTLLVSQATAILGQDLPPELGSSIKSLQDAKAYCERVLREVEAGTSVLVPFQVKTVDGKTMLIDEYRSLPKDQQPKVLETERLPVEVKDLQLRLSAAKLSAEDQKRIIGDMVADSRANTGTLKKRLAKIEEGLGLSPVQTGTSSGQQVTLHGEVVEVTGDKVRIALKSKSEPQVGDPVKINYEIAGTDIKADVAKGKVAKVEPGFANVDITNKTAEIRKGYLAEIKSSPTVEGTKEPQPAKELDLTGEWINQADKVEPLFNDPVKTFRLEKTAQDIFRVPGSDSRAHVRIVKDEPWFMSQSGARLATGKVERDPKTGAVVSIRWSAGSTWTRNATVANEQSLNLTGEWTMAGKDTKDSAFGTEFTNPKSFRLEKTPQGTFVNPGSTNARIVFAKDELLFFNNAGIRGATAKIEADPKTGAIERIAWSDGSVFTRNSTSGVGPLSKSDLTGRWVRRGVGGEYTNLDTGKTEKWSPKDGDSTTWKLTRRPDGRYDADGQTEEKKSLFVGIGVLTGDVFKLEWKNKFGESQGTDTWTLDAERKGGKATIQDAYNGRTKGYLVTGYSVERLDSGLPDPTKVGGNEPARTDAEKALADAEAALRKAQERFDRAVKLFRDGDIKEADLNADRAARDAARALLDRLKGAQSPTDLTGEWTMKASEATAFGTEFTNPKSFRLEKSPQGTFVNAGSTNARIVIVKDELHFFNNAGTKTATAKINADPKAGAVERIEWSDGSVFTRLNAAATDSSPRPRPNGALLFEDRFNTAEPLTDPVLFPKSMSFENQKGVGKLVTTFRGVAGVIYSKQQAKDFAAEYEFDSPAPGPNSSFGFFFRGELLPGPGQRIPNYYLLLIDPTAQRGSLACWQKTWSFPLAFTLKQGLLDNKKPNKVRLEAVGDNFRVFLNGSFVGQVADARIGDAGIFGFMVYANKEENNTIYFSNLRVYAISEKQAELKKDEKSPDLSGRWSDSFSDKDLSGKFEWTLQRRPDGRYDMQGTGEGNCTVGGKADKFYIEKMTTVATVVGSTLKFEWKGKDLSGSCEWKLDALIPGTKAWVGGGIGQNLAYIYGTKFEFESKMRRQDGAAPPIPQTETKTASVDLSGRWEDRDNSLALTLNRRPDGRYDVRHIGIKEFGNDPQGQGLGQLVGDALKIDFDGGGRFRHKGHGMWKLDARRGGGDGFVVIYSGTKEKEDSRYSSILERLDFAPVEPKKTEKEKTGDTPPKTETLGDLSGRWEDSSYFGRSIWILKRLSDGRYDAQQTDFGKASGIGTLAGDIFKIDWTALGGAHQGYLEWTLNAGRDLGKGKSVVVKGEVGTFSSSFKRLEVRAEPRKAEEPLERFNEQDRLNAYKACMYKGEIALDSKVYADAVRLFRDALRYRPNDEKARYFLERAERALENNSDTKQDK